MLFSGNISDIAKRNMEIFLNDNTVIEFYTKRYLAYLLATVYHETAFVKNRKLYRNMAPVEEVGRGSGRRYGKPGSNGKIFYGRGHIQLTWEDNYIKVGNLIGVDLYNNPELALDENISSEIAIKGMLYGWFTGRKLSDFLNTKLDYVNARRIINGTDKASIIASYASIFEKCLI